MVEKNPALVIAGIQARYAAVELIREEIRRLEAISHAEIDVIRADIEADHGLDMSEHLIAVARGMFDLDSLRSTGSVEALSLIGDGGLFSAARNSFTPVVIEAPAQLQQQTRADVVTVVPTQTVESSKVVPPRPVAPSDEFGETLYGIDIKQENVEEARKIVVQAKQDADRGRSAGRFKESRGRYIWRRKLYDAALAAFAAFPKLEDRAPVAQPRPLMPRPAPIPVDPVANPQSTAVNVEPAVLAETVQIASEAVSLPVALGLRRSPLQLVDPPDPGSGPAQPEIHDPHVVAGETDLALDIEQEVAWPDIGDSFEDEVFGADGETVVITTSEVASLQAAISDVDLDDLPPSLRYQIEAPPDHLEPDSGPGILMDERPTPPEGVYDAQGQYRESIAGNNLFDQQGHQDPEAPNFKSFGFGDNAYGLTRGQRKRKF